MTNNFPSVQECDATEA